MYADDSNDYIPGNHSIDQANRTPDKGNWVSGWLDPRGVNHTDMRLSAVLNLAAQHRDGKWVMVYLAWEASISINLDKIRGAETTTALRVDPRNGTTASIGNFPTTGLKSFSTPDGREGPVTELADRTGAGHGRPRTYLQSGVGCFDLLTS